MVWMTCCTSHTAASFRQRWLRGGPRFRPGATTIHVSLASMTLRVSSG